ncbi:MAG: EFR1 family ferrodoxin [Firmicutes bacterium]|jgi:ferredoxin|nr:EFR1 family ferrodoxin [Bacillota bacterium]
MRTEIYYFTGTGNGLFIAKSIKAKLESNNESVNLIAINTIDLSNEIVSEAEKIGIVYPTYAMTAPKIVKDFAKQLRVRDNKYLFLYGHSGGGGARVAVNAIKIILQERGINISNTFETTFPSNSAIKAYGTEQLKAILDKSEESIEKNVSSIVNAEERNTSKLNLIRKSSLLLAENLAVIGEKFMGFKKISSDDTCIGCATCVKVCPVENIKLSNNRPVFSDKCEMCLACVNQCPKKSLSYGKMKKANMMSYRHPDVTLKELMYR